MERRVPQRRYKLWLIRFICALFVLLAATAVFNYSVDSVGVFGLNKGLRSVAENMTQGKMVAGPLGRDDERELQMIVVEIFQGKRSVVAIGSSRTMPLRGKFIRGADNFFNHSVSGALLEDFTAITGLYRNKNTFPDTVIFGIDPWMFNKDNGLTDSWRTLERYYKEMMADVAATSKDPGLARAATKKSDALNRYEQLINLEYTIQNVYFSRKKKERLYVTNTIEIDDFVREPDGSIHFPYNMRHVKMPNTGPLSPPMNPPDRYYKNFEVIAGAETFGNLVRYLKKRGVRVVLLLPPLHPASYRACKENPTYGITLRVEAYLRDLGRAENITVVGSFDPERYGFKGEEFFDGHHGHDIVMKRLFEDYQ